MARTFLSNRATFAPGHRRAARSNQCAVWRISGPPISLLEATVELIGATAPVIAATASVDFRCGAITVARGEQIYYIVSTVASTDVPRYYVALRDREGAWHFSYRDERTARVMIARVEALLARGEFAA